MLYVCIISVKMSTKTLGRSEIQIENQIYSSLEMGNNGNQMALILSYSIEIRVYVGLY